MLANVTATKEDELIAARASESVRSREADFQRAQAHSSKVRVLKWVLPVLGGGIALVFGAHTFLSRVPELSYDIASVAYADGKLVMANPQLKGLTEDDRPYSMTAARAIQDPAKQNVVELEGIDAMLPIDAEHSAAIKAERGVYDSSANTLVVTTPMTVNSTNGMIAKLNSAHLNIDARTLRTEEPVEIIQNGNKITADTLSIVESGKVFIFEKRVRLNITPQPRQQDARLGDENAGN